MTTRDSAPDPEDTRTLDEDPHAQDPFPEEPPWVDEQGEWEYDPDLPHTWPDDERRAWSITNDALAEWAMRKYARAEQDVERIRKQAKLQIEELEDQIAAINARVEEACASSFGDIDFFGFHLNAYLSRLQSEGRAKKSYKLLNGDLTSRKTPGRLEVDESERVLADLKARGLASIKVTPDKAAIKQWLADHPGESIPGVELVVEERFKPKPIRQEQPAFLPMPGEDVREEAA